MTRADVPSGKTSQSFAETNATGAVDVTVSSTRGCPMISSSSSNGPHSYTSERASSARWSAGCPQGSRPAQEIHADAPTSPRTVSTSVPAGGSGRSASGRTRSSGQPGSERHSPRISARSGSGRVERRTKTWMGGSSSTPFASSRSQRPNQRQSSGTRSMCGPGSDVAVDMWLHGPISSRLGQSSASNVRKLLLRYPSAQPATIIVGHAIRAYPGRSEPCRQYGPSTCSSSQRSSHGSPSSSRRRHSSRHPSPKTAGTGGRAFSAAM